MNEQALQSPPASEADETTDALSDTRQYVTFLVNGEAFAVDMSPVQEIIRLPEAVRVPLSPRSLLGLANLRGRVLPIISLRRIFGFDELEHDDSTRAVVIDIGQPLGFVVDRVASVLNVEPSQIDDVTEIRSTVDSELLTGILKGVGGYQMIMVLDFERLIAREFAEIAAIARNGSALLDGTPAALGDEEDDDVHELQLVSFAVVGQEYAIEISSVQEIVQVPEHVVHVPRAQAHVLGLMTLRERLLPLVSLRSLFSLPNRELDEGSRVVVIGVGNAAVGLVTDSVSEVLRVPFELVEQMPELLARDPSLDDIRQICRLNQGKRIVSIISAEQMFSHGGVKDALESVSDMSDRDTHAEEDVESDDDEQVVIFQLADGEFGVPIDSVQEIVRIPETLTHVPKAPDFVEGVINLRGSVLPIIDQRKRLDLPAIERSDRQRIMVFLLAGVRTGFIVDAVTEVLKIPHCAIESSPLLSGEQARLLGRVANLEKQGRMVQLIDPAKLVAERDQAELADMTQ
ncbi:chemotaxis protein CheW [Metapseudomonas otitidis]|uniref:chemotaxis protein CheW n=1 Tax=Metapseudomonas otitidis TaxID=319939 RepID=UPI0013F5D380|nr:chemotaxis protein CheW [Pseudomonas otitidis]